MSAVRKNLALFSEHSVAQIRDLASSTGRSLNGQSARVTGWDKGKNRYVVKVPELSGKSKSRQILVKPENLAYQQSQHEMALEQRSEPPVHVLLSVRLVGEGEDNNPSLFRAKQCISSIFSQFEQCFSVFVLASGDSSDGDAKAEIESYLREAVISRNGLQMWYFKASSGALLPEMKQMSELCSMSSSVDPNAWLMPFDANDMMSSVRVQYLGDYLRQGQYSKDDYLNGLAMTIVGKLVVKNTEHVVFSGFENARDWKTDPVLVRASYFNHDVVERRMSGPFDYCMHT